MASKKPPPPVGGDIDNGWKLEVGTTVTFLVAAIAVGLRCLARVKYAQRGWDDYLMIFALLQALIATIIDFVACNDGLGRHTYYLTASQTINQQYYSFLAQVFCVHALTFAKISIAVSYLRILRGSASASQQIWLWAVAILTFIINTVVILTFYVGCTPNAKSWNPSIPGTCWLPKTKIIFVLLQGSWSAFSDIFLALFPFAMLKKLQINRQTKVIILGLMSLGLLTGAFAIVRTVESSNQLNPPPGATPDVSFSTVEGLMWSGMERNVAIMVGSVPAMRPLLPPIQAMVSNTLRRLITMSGRTTRQTSTYQMKSASKFHKLSEDQERLAKNSARRDGEPVMVSAGRDVAPSEHV